MFVFKNDLVCFFPANSGIPVFSVEAKPSNKSLDISKCFSKTDLLVSVEVSKRCNAVMLVVGSTQLEWKCRRSTAGVFGQQGLQVSLSCLLLLLQSLQSLGSFLEGISVDVLEKCTNNSRGTSDIRLTIIEFNKRGTT